MRKDFKSKTQEFTKPYYNKQTNMLTSVTDANTYKSQPGKFHDFHRTEIKKNIETTRHNFENYNEIMKRIESKRNINPNRSMHDRKDVKEYYTTKQKYEIMKNIGPMKRILFSSNAKDQKRLQPDTHQRKTFGYLLKMFQMFLSSCFVYVYVFF